MGDESESAGEPSRDRDGDDEPTDRVTESTDTAPDAEPVTEETSDGDVERDDAGDGGLAADDGATVDAESDAGGLEPVSDTDADDADAETTDTSSEESPSPDADGDETGDADESSDVDDPGEASEADGGFENEMPDGFADEFSHLDDDDDDFADLDDGLVEGPDTDQEMPLADHIEEMVRRLAVVFILGGGVALSVFGLGEVLAYVPSTVDIINFLWNQHIPGAGLPGNEDLRPHVYGPLELILTKLKVAGLVGVVVGLPVFVYQSYLFMRPGLYQNERKYYLASVPTSLILAVVGVAFAHFVVLPSIFAYFTSYTTGTALIAFGLAETFNLILILMGYMAIVFQIPLFIMLAIMMNLVTREWLEDKRLIFWGAFLGLAFLVSPDPTGMAPIIIAITMVTLFEGTLALLRWTGN